MMQVDLQPICAPIRMLTKTASFIAASTLIQYRAIDQMIAAGIRTGFETNGSEPAR